jgi:hypothetical protein
MAWRGGARLSDAPGSMAGVYGVDLTEAIEELGAAFRDSLRTVLLHLINVSVAKKRITLARLHGPVFPEDKISSFVKSRD